MSKEGSHCACLSAILIDSTFWEDKNYYRQNVAKTYKRYKFINDELGQT